MMIVYALNNFYGPMYNVFENYPNRQLTFNYGTAAVVWWPSQLLSNFDKWTKFDSKQITKSVETSTIQFSTET